MIKAAFGMCEQNQTNPNNSARHSKHNSLNIVLNTSLSGQQMTQPIPMPENSRGNRNIWIAALAIGLVIGLGLGIIISVVFILPRMTQEAILGFAINPVQVSGTVRAVKKGGIQFINENETTSTRYNHHVPIVDNNYSIVLSGGYSYTAYISIGGLTTYLYSYSLYVPANVTILTANFPP